MMRVIVHPGFHKTGTSTVQAQLQGAQALWGKRWIVGLRAQMAGVAHNARLYAQSRDPLDLGLTQSELADWLDAQDWSEAEGAVISCEDFAGLMPGRQDARDYSAAPQLMAAFAEVLEDFFAGQLRLHLHFSTRAPEGWWPSVHWQNVRTGTLTQTWVEFQAEMQGAMSLEAVVEQVRGAVPSAQVSAMRLEESQRLASGPITPLLDLMGLPEAERGAFVPDARRNARPEHRAITHIADRCAAINANFPDIATAQKRKRQLLDRVAAAAQETQHD